MKEHLRYTPLRVDLTQVVPAYTARPGDTIEVFTHPDNKCNGKRFDFFVRKVRLYEQICKGSVVRLLEANIIGGRSGRSIGGGTAIIRKKISDSESMIKTVKYKYRGRVRVTTFRI